MATPKSDPHISLGSFSDDTITPRKKRTSCKTSTEATTSPLVQKSPVVRSLFMDTSTSNTKSKPWIIVGFQPLDVCKFFDAPLPLLD